MSIWCGAYIDKCVYASVVRYDDSGNLCTNWILLGFSHTAIFSL